MTAGTWTLTTTALEDLINGTFNIATDTYHCILVASTSNISASSTTMAAVTGELSTANGYTAGGFSMSALTIAGTSPYNINFTANPTWTASGGSIVARWAVVGKTGGNVLAFVLLDNTPADVTTTNGNQLIVNASGTPSSFFTLTKSP